MFMSSIVWSYNKNLLHYGALKKHLVVGKFQLMKENIIFRTFNKKRIKNLVSSILCITINRFYGCYCDSSKRDLYNISFSITFVNNNPHNYCNMRQFLFVMDDIGVSWAIDVLG